MSRSTNDQLTSPVVKFLKWNSSEKSFQYYDKNKYNEEKDRDGMDVNFPAPFSFYVLDELFSIKGYNEKKSEGIYSNEVRKNTDKIIIRSKSGIVMQGIYGSKTEPDLNEKKDSVGGKYVKSVYIAMLDENDEYQIYNIQFQGSGFEGWVEFTKANKNYQRDEITFSGETADRKKGKNKYNIPVFSIQKATESGNNAAIELDKQLQEYLKLYLAKTGEPTPVAAGDDAPDNTDTDDSDY